MSSVTYKSDTSRTELQGEVDRASMLQQERVDALNSGIVKDISGRRTEVLSRTEGAPSAVFERKSKRKHEGENRTLQDESSDPSSNGVQDLGKKPSVGAYIADELVYEELDESDELDDVAPIYRDVRNVQRILKGRKMRKAQARSSLQDETLNGAPRDGSAATPRTRALSKKSPRTASLHGAGSREKKRRGPQLTSRRATQTAKGPAALAQRTQQAAAAKAATSAKATTAAATRTAAGAAGFPIAGVLGVLLMFVLGVLAIAQIISAIFGFWEDAEAKQSLVGLPPYITYEMVEEALLCQEEYGHPAGCTIAQIICESGMGDHMSALATRDHNLFGMKWASSFAGCPEVTGSASWVTGEEYDGHQVTITDRFIVFAGDRECIRFRSRVFLQASHYKNNPLIKEAISSHSSDKMVEGLKAAGWATSSSYVESLKSILKTYDLYRFDSMTADDLKSGLISGDSIVQAAYSQLGTPYVWGGTTPNVGLDCSGLTQYCYAQAGISIPRNSEDQHESGTSIPLSEAKPGDILWRPGHVAIFVSGDTYIHAPHEGDVVRVAQGSNYFTCAVTYR